MAESDKSSASDGSRASAGKPDALSKAQKDLVLLAMDETSKVVTGLKPESVVEAISTNLDNLMKSLLPKDQPPFQDSICDRPGSDIAGFCHQRTLDMKKAEIAYNGSKTTASAALAGALDTYSLAVDQYNFDIANAESTMRATVTEATTAYNAKNNPDSKSRSFYLFYTLKQAIAGAIQTYEASAKSAGDTLAGAVGDLLVSYAGYVEAINTAQSQLLYDEATAYQTFWQGVESVRDSVP